MKVLKNKKFLVATFIIIDLIISALFVGVLYAANLNKSFETENNFSVSKANDEIGRLYYRDDKYVPFASIDELQSKLNEYWSQAVSLRVELEKDLNFNAKTIEIIPSRELIFNIYNYKLFSINEQKESNALFMVKGNLFLTGKDETTHGTLHQSNDDSTINIHDNGSVAASYVDFKGVHEESIQHKISNSGGHLYFDYSCSMASSFNDCKFMSETNSSGGCVSFFGEKVIKSPTNFTKCIFEGNAKSTGGAFYCSSKNANFNFDTCEFKECYTYMNGDGGGAIATDSNDGSKTNHSTFTFNNTVFNTCSSKTNGGAIVSSSMYDDFIFNDCSITNCTAEDEGGAIYSAEDHVQYIFNDSGIYGCNAAARGGGIYLKSSDVKIIGNYSNDKDFFGKMGLEKNGQLTNRSSIQNCSSRETGGAGIYTSNATGSGNDVFIDHIDFIGNRALGSSAEGGALYLRGQHNVVTNCYFHDNESGENGGAIYITDGRDESSVSQCVFHSNKSGVEDGDGVGNQIYDNRSESYYTTIYNNTVYHMKNEFNPEKEFSKSLVPHWTDCFKAKESLDKYEIQYNEDTKFVDAGDVFSIESLPQKPGYVFGGWFIEWNDGSVKDLAYDDKYRIFFDKDSFKIVPKWKSMTFEMSLHFDPLKKQTIYEKYNEGFFFDRACEEKIDTLTVPDKEHYTFDGYYKKNGEEFVQKVINSEGKIIVDSTEFVSDTNLYANWIPDVYKIVLDNSEGTPENNCIYEKFDDGFYYDEECNNKVEQVQIPSKENYIFDGYFAFDEQIIDNNGSICNNIKPSKFKEDTKLLAKWKNGILKITLNDFGGSGGSDYFYEKYGFGFYSNKECTEEIKGPLKIPTREGFVFGGYYTNDNAQAIDENGYFNEGITVTYFKEDTELKAVWTDVYSITLDNDNADIPGTTVFYEKYDIGFFHNIECTTPFDVINLPQKTGHNFEGYFIKDGTQFGDQIIGTDGKLTISSSTYFKQNTILYAKWTPVTCTITLDSDGAQSPGTTKIYETYGKKFYSDSSSDISTIITPTKSKNHFFGYYTKNGDLYDECIIDRYGKILVSNTKFTEDITLYAKWAPIYKITLNDLKGSGGSKQFYERYDEGFYSNEECTIKIKESFLIPTYKNYKFCGYYIDDGKFSTQIINEKGQLNNSITPKRFMEDTELVAYWQEGVYTINLDNQDADTRGTELFYEKYNIGFFQNIECTKAFDSIQIPKKTGHDFNGYYIKKGETYDKQIIGSDGKLVSGVSYIDFESDTTLYAKWSLSAFTITYKDQNGEDFSGIHEKGYPITHTYNSKTLLKSASKEGYTFKGWHKQSDCSDNAVIEIKEKDYTDNITLYALWIPNTYKITYKDQNDTAYSGENLEQLVISHTYDTKTTLTSGYKLGFSFEGWHTVPDCSDMAIKVIDEKSFTKDFTLYAKWGIGLYNIQVHSNGPGKTFSNVTNANIGDKISLYNMAENNGQFVKYQILAPKNLSINDDNTFEMPANNVVIIATYSQKVVPNNNTNTPIYNYNTIEPPNNTNNNSYYYGSNNSPNDSDKKQESTQVSNNLESSNNDQFIDKNLFMFAAIGGPIAGAIIGSICTSLLVVFIIKRKFL